MAQYAIHKLGFYYNDEAEVAVESGKGFRGSLVKVFDSLEKAQEGKAIIDFETIKKLSGKNLLGYFDYRADQEEALAETAEFYQKTFQLKIDTSYSIPILEEMTQDQATHILQLLELSFHEIVEYEDQVELKEKDFGVPEDWDFIWEFD